MKFPSRRLLSSSIYRVFRAPASNHTGRAFSNWKLGERLTLFCVPTKPCCYTCCSLWQSDISYKTKGEVRFETSSTSARVRIPQEPLTFDCAISTELRCVCRISCAGPLTPASCHELWTDSHPLNMGEDLQALTHELTLKMGEDLQTLTHELTRLPLAIFRPNFPSLGLFFFLMEYCNDGRSQTQCLDGKKKASREYCTNKFREKHKDFFF